MKSDKDTSRKRGVKASRVKLTQALTHAGLKTQAALANKIADLEGLEAAPKDMVSRAFREVPVELQTLERIARALNVELHTLFKAASEDDIPTTTTRALPQNHLPLVFAVVASLATFTLGWWLMAQRAEPPVKPSVPVAFPELGLGEPTLAVMPFRGDDSGDFARALRIQLAEEFTVASATSGVITRSLDAAEVQRLLRTDAVVEGEQVTVGRLVGLRVYLLARGVRRHLWAESLPIVVLDQQREQLASRAADAVLQATGRAAEGGQIPHFPSPRVQDEYLFGEKYLEAAANELNIRRAQSSFESALRQDPAYARGHAGLCRSLLEEYWMDDEQRILDDASSACTEAVRLAPDDPVVQTAHANFLRLTGRNERAIEIYAGVVANRPWDATAQRGLARSHMHAFQQHGEKASLDRAREAVLAAGTADPYVWKPFFLLGSIEWFRGDHDAAIAASEAALARNENEFILANLGTFYICEGRDTEAVELFLRAHDLAPQSYATHRSLGTAYILGGDYAKSVEHRRKSVASIVAGEPEFHELWGELAEAYRHNGEHAAATDAYLNAVEIVERDFLRGNARIVDRVARVFYYLVIHELQPDRVPIDILKEIDAEIDELVGLPTTPLGQRYMTQVHQLRGNESLAREALSNALEQCLGYRHYPGFQALAETIPNSAPSKSH